MFDEHGQAVVTDFGIAKAATGGKLTGTGMSIGTPHYMSPEQARAQALDGRSDVYSLGVVAYQCLTARVPFDGEDSFAIERHARREALVGDDAERVDVAAAIQRLGAGLLGAHVMRRADRHAGARELAAGRRLRDAEIGRAHV